MSDVRGRWDQLAPALRAELQERSRGVVVVIEDPGRKLDAADVHKTLPGVHWIDLHRASDAELHAANQQRDAWLPANESVVFRVADGEEARRLYRETPDLTSHVDLRLVHEDATAAPVSEVLNRLRDSQLQRHATLDLSGLLPAAPDKVTLPLDEVYLRDAGLRPDFKLDAKPALVLAPPGAGKTTTLRWLAWGQAAGQPSDHLQPDRLAIFIPLSGWAAARRDRTITLEEHLRAALGRLIEDGPVDLDPLAGRIVLLLDGLDEVPQRADRRAALTEAAELHRRGLQTIVSARDYIRDDLTKDHRDAWALESLSEPQPDDALKLARKILDARGAPDAEAIAAAIERHPDLDHFARSPLLMTFLVVMASVQRRLPSQRAELYRDLVEMLIHSWRRVRGAGGRSLSRGDVLRVVAPLGWALVTRGVGGLTQVELLDVLRPLEQQRGGTPEEADARARRRLDLLRDDTALLRTDDDLLRFTHPTIAEYLAADAALADPSKLQRLLDAPYDPAWQQVIPFALAIVVDLQPRDDVANRLVAALNQHAKRRGVYDAKIPATLAACLVEVPGLPSAQRGELADHVFRVALAQRLSPDSRWHALQHASRIVSLDDVREVAQRWLDRPGLAATVRTHDFWGSVPVMSFLAAAHRAGLRTERMVEEVTDRYDINEFSDFVYIFPIESDFILASIRRRVASAEKDTQANFASLLLVRSASAPSSSRQALDRAREAVYWWRKAGDAATQPTDYSLLNGLMALAPLELQHGDPTTARALAREFLDLSAAAEPSTAHREAAQMETVLSDASLALGDVNEALAACDAALHLVADPRDHEHRPIARRASVAVARALLAAARASDALKLLELTIQNTTPLLPWEPPDGSDNLVSRYREACESLHHEPDPTLVERARSTAAAMSGDDAMAGWATLVPAFPHQG